MFIAKICGWEETIAVADTERKAKNYCMKDWKRRCGDDVQDWNWKQIVDYFGGYTEEIKGNCFVISDYGVKEI